MKMIDQGSSALDYYFAEFLADRSGLGGTAKGRFQDLVARVSKALEDGHSCLLLSEGEEQFLRVNPLVSDGGRTPLVVHNHRLYLHRYFYYETRLAEQIKVMAAITLAPELEGPLIDLYMDDSGSDINWQKEAAKVALSRALTIISGGPGTGKTTTVVKILALLLQDAEGRPDLTLALAAPTGKAAMRLSEAVGRSLTYLQLPEKVKNSLPTSASTLHRLLGVRRGSPQFRHNRDNPLGWDIVVVDEASMVDLAMMSKLVDAIKPGARLILLGDKDQLASVESGAVLGDFIKSLPRNTVELQKTYRFEASIKGLAEAINGADSDIAWGMLTDSKTANIALLDEELIGFITKRYIPFMEMVNQPGAVDLSEVFALFNSFRVLCALHYGSRGVEPINRQVEMALMQQGFPCRPENWYPGRPVLINRNDYDLDLYNGDIGICMPDLENGRLQVWFERPGGGLRSYHPSRLPSCRTVFAMTIHKSQGSEFDEVVVVLPEDDNRILSRELVYTAVTRAKKAVRLVAEKEILRLALSRNIERASGLADLLTK
ncbi:MAG: exodeoxyribonuclease V subunit alpha [Proteobacteria bacterium]|nr:exodeoxyribonuclease V subunit alpha [Pseudomonadota bacterium]